MGMEVIVIIGAIIIVMSNPEDAPQEKHDVRPITDRRDSDLAVRPVVSATDPAPLAVSQAVALPAEDASCSLRLKNGAIFVTRVRTPHLLTG